MDDAVSKQTSGKQRESELPSAPRWYQSFRLRLVLFVAVAVAGVATAVGVVAYGAARDNLENQIHERLDDLVRSRTVLLRTHLDHLARQSSLITSRTNLRERVADYRNKAISEDELRRGIGRILLDARDTASTFLELAVADLDGRIIAATRADLVGTSISSQRALQSGLVRPYLTEPVRVSDGSFRSTITAPLRDRDGQVIGILYAPVDASAMHRAVSAPPRGWKSGEIMVAATDGDKVHYLFQPTEANGRLTSAETPPAPVSRALRGEVGHQTMIDRHGRKVLAAYSPVAESDEGLTYGEWALITKVDSEEAYAPVESMRWVIAGLSLALGLLMLAVAYVIASRITRPMARLTLGALATAENPKSPIVVPDRHDEIGVLGAAFAHMRAELVAHQADLEARVATRTSELERANRELATQVDERSRLLDELREAKSQAEASSRAKSAFLAAMSHEIRTPMNGIVGMGELLSTTPLAPIQREYVDLMRDSAESLLEVINDILDFSRMEAGRIELIERPFGLRELVGSTASAFADRAHSKDLELTVRVAPNVPDCVIGDPLRVRQILVNLINNAIKFTDEGEVVVDVTADDVHDDIANLQFEVRDTGPGIPADRQTDIFRAFQQGDSSSTRRYGGTGLGLTISSRLVEMMGGKITIDSAVGMGSRFHFRCPMKVAPARMQPPQPSLLGLRVLVIDDNATNRRVLQEMVKQLGLTVQTTGDAHAALELLLREQARGRPFDVLLLDANMPSMDGFQLARELRADNRIHSTVILMLSSADRPGDVQRCKELGIEVYLLKPVKQSDLVRAIERACGKGTREQPARKPTAMEPRRILLAEDNRVSQRLAVDFLESWGHDVTLVDNGRDAVAMVRGGPPFDLVLMDVQMPEMDGFQATGAIRGHEERTGGHVPIIAMTAHAMKGDRERCLAAGMDGYLSKPVRAEQLRNAIEQFASAASAHSTDTESKRRRTGDQCIDWSDALEQLQGRESLLLSMAEAFLEDCPAWIESVESALRTDDIGGLRRTAHSIKGAAQTLSARPVADRAKALEMAAHDQRLQDAGAIWQRLAPQLDRLTRELGERLARAASLGHTPSPPPA